ncbi:MAG: hemerythrin domain-containing protein [Candidatus Scalindua sp.]
MSALIEEFKREHAKIIAMLNEVKEFGILSKEGQAKLMTIKAHLLAHFKKEDEKLYPVLRKEAEDNERLKNTLDLFAMDMEKVSSVVQKVFDKYSKGEIDENFPRTKGAPARPAGGEDFSINFDSLFAALSTRIRNEENALYEEYEEYEEINR